MKELKCIYFNIEDINDMDRLNKYLRSKEIDDKNLITIAKSQFTSYDYTVWYWKEIK